MANATRIFLIVGAIILPIAMIVVAIKIWDTKSKKMSQTEREDALAKISLSGTVITSMAILYAILFNFYNWERFYRK